MPRTSFSKLIDTLKSNYPEINFTQDADTFSWKPSSETILFNPEESGASELLLHELGHAISGHDRYSSDIELLRMEREAWSEATLLASKYEIDIDDDFIEDSLDTYREWIHQKSTCPSCSSTGFQNNKGMYTCPVCRVEWKVNDGIVCRIYRKKL